MCRGSHKGGRRCPGTHSSDTRRAISSAQRQVQRTARKLADAQAASNPEQINAAQTRHDQARKRLDDVTTAAAHATAGEDTAGEDTAGEDTAGQQGDTTPTTGTGQHHQGARQQRDPDPEQPGARAQTAQDPGGQDQPEPEPAGQSGDTTTHELPGGGLLVNTNVVMPGATVGEQTAVSYGPTTFSHTTEHVSTDHVSGGADQTTGGTPDAATKRARRAAERLRRAAERASRARTGSGQASGIHHDNVASGHDHVQQQIGINFGQTHHNHHDNDQQ